MHIAVFNQYHSSPDCAATSRHYSFLAALARRHRVSLITTNAWLHQRITQDFPWVPEGVELHAFEVPYSNRMGRGQRMLSFGQFAVQAYRRGMQLEQPDVIWGISTPLTAAWAASRVAGRRRVPWVFEVQDLWPAFPIQMGAVPGKWLQRRLHAAEKKLYAHADHIITLSPDMAAHIAQVGVPESKVSTLLNGTDLGLLAASPDPEQLSLRKRHGLGDRQVVLYAGTYGRANNIPLLLEVARRLRDRPDICFVFTGAGFQEPLLREAAQELPSVVVVPPQPRQHIFAWFRLASLSLVPFLNLPVLHANSPAKLYDSLAAGTPVIVTNPGWTKTLVEDHACGWYSPGQPAALAASIEQALADPVALAAAGERGQALANQAFDRRRQAGQIEQILEGVVERQKAARSIPY